MESVAYGEGGIGTVAPSAQFIAEHILKRNIKFALVTFSDFK